MIPIFAIPDRIETTDSRIFNQFFLGFFFCLPNRQALRPQFAWRVCKFVCNYRDFLLK